MAFAIDEDSEKTSRLPVFFEFSSAFVLQSVPGVTLSCFLLLPLVIFSPQWLPALPQSISLLNHPSLCHNLSIFPYFHHLCESVQFCPVFLEIFAI